MKWMFLVVVLAFAAGCRTTSIESRRQEKSSAYASLTPEHRALVDQGQIAIGMPMDAVFIAWGKPTQVFTGQSAQGTITRWIYTGTTWQEIRYWNYHHDGPYRGYYGVYGTPYLDYDYIPRSYTAAEVVFENGLVQSWQNITQPPPY